VGDLDAQMHEFSTSDVVVKDDLADLVVWVAEIKSLIKAGGLLTTRTPPTFHILRLFRVSYDV